MFFVQFFCVFLPPLLNIFYFHFYPLLRSSLHEMFPWYLNFLQDISSLSHSIVFLYFFALISEKGFLISPCYSLELCIQMLISFLFSFAFHFFSFHSYMWGLLRQPLCFFAFLFPGDGLDPYKDYSFIFFFSIWNILLWTRILSRGTSWPRDPNHLSLCLLNWQVCSLPLALPGKPSYCV